jgi:hypothetical protein
VRPSPREHLRRVEGQIADLVRAFVAEAATWKPAEFHPSELETYVEERGVAAPGSAARILRLLRARGEIAYENVSRTRSRYRVLQGVAEVLPAQGELPLR